MNGEEECAGRRGGKRNGREKMDEEMIKRKGNRKVGRWIEKRGRDEKMREAKGAFVSQ